MKSIKVILFSFVSSLLIIASAMSGDKPKAEAQAETGVILPDSADITIDTTISAEQEITDKIIAYYFHGTRRCVTCKKIEAYSQEAIESKFKRELESGQLEFHSVNFDEEDNKHFIKDYELYTKSLVVCDYNKGKQARWKNLEKIWQHVRDKEEFFKYVQNEISSYLEDSLDE